MFFVLATDYDLKTELYLSAEDQKHFALINTRLDDARILATLPDLRRTKQYTEVGRHLVYHLISPCLALGLPVKHVVRIIVRFFNFLYSDGAYRGCTEGVARYYGKSTLAAKVYYDKTIIIPHIIPATKPKLRQKLLQRLESVSSCYFLHVSGVRAIKTGGDQQVRWEVEYKLKPEGQKGEVPCTKDENATARTGWPRCGPLRWSARRAASALKALAWEVVLLPRGKRSDQSAQPHKITRTGGNGTTTVVAVCCC